MTMVQTLADIRADLDFLDDWDDRYRYLIDLGRTLPKLPDDAYSDSFKVAGCASQVWLLLEKTPEGRFSIRGDSDALIVKGLVALVIALFNDKTGDEVRATDAQAFFSDIGLKEHLSSQRANGLASMVARIKASA
jgi:cysteine desulfuration protein SufE